MPVNANDPRVKRTRQLLMQSFMQILEEKILDIGTGYRNESYGKPCHLLRPLPG